MKKFFRCLMLLSIPIVATGNPATLENTEFAASIGMPLPEWSPEDTKRIADGENLVQGTLFDWKEAQAEAIIEVPKQEEEFSNQIPPSEIPDEALAKYFLSPLSALLLDPQSLLSSQEYLDTEAFLKYHQAESGLSMRIYLFDKEQKIPLYFQSDSTLKHNGQEDRETAVIYYFMGAPERAELYLTAEITGKIGNQERLRCLQNSIKSASNKSQELDQLEAFCVQMSISIYRLEKAIAEGKDFTQSSLAASPLSSTQKKDFPTFLSKIYQELQSYLFPIVLTFIVFCIAWLFSWFRKKRRTYVFDELDVSPRLGAEHAAGVGGVISYSVNHRSIADHQPQVPDYINRH